MDARGHVTGGTSVLVPLMLRRVDGSADPQRDAEGRLVARAQEGDRDALGQLLHQHGPTLYRTVLLPRLGSEAAAQDALAETYARVVAKLHLFRWQGVGFYPWLRTVALRVALDALRARKRLTLWSEEDVAREIDEADRATPTDEVLARHRDRQAARKRVDDALERLHPRYARALRLRVLEERPREEVAALLEVTPATFDVVLHRATMALKKVLLEDTARGSDPEGPGHGKR